LTNRVELGDLKEEVCWSNSRDPAFQQDTSRQG